MEAAWQMAERGRDIASSASVRAGYFAREILPTSWLGVASLPEARESLVSNMKPFHCAHHCSIEANSAP